MFYTNFSLLFRHYFFLKFENLQLGHGNPFRTDVRRKSRDPRIIRKRSSVGELKNSARGGFQGWFSREEISEGKSGREPSISGSRHVISRPLSHRCWPRWKEPRWLTPAMENAGKPETVNGKKGAKRILQASYSAPRGFITRIRSYLISNHRSVEKIIL